jgi:dolichyl-phosphate beta-glucosyltransferase
MERLLTAMERGADVAIGSRALYSPDTRVERKWGRAVVGRIFAFLVNVWVVPGIADTQCGFKLFRRDVAHHIFELQQLEGFAFDVEVLRLAAVLGYRIVEVPVNWTNIRGSKVRIVRDACRMFWDVLRVRYLVPQSLGTMSQRIRSTRFNPEACQDEAHFRAG